jgi:exonuclease III
MPSGGFDELVSVAPLHQHHDLAFVEPECGDVMRAYGMSNNSVLPVNNFNSDCNVNNLNFTCNVNNLNFDCNDDLVGNGNCNTASNDENIIIDPDNNITTNCYSQANTTSNIKILSWNIQGIGNKLELKGTYEFLSKYDIIFLTETMKLDSYKPTFDGYQYFHCQRSFQHHRARRPSGGIAVLIKNNLVKFVEIEKASEYVMWIKIKQTSNPPILISGTYIPPHGSTVYLNTNVYDIYNTLQQDIANYLKITPFISVCGDFNSRTGKLCDYEKIIVGKDSNLVNNVIRSQPSSRNKASNWHSKDRQTKDPTHNAFGKELIQLCKTSNMRIMNGFLNEKQSNAFTCYAPLGESVVDYLICTQEMADLINNFNICSKLVESDHTPMSFELNIDIQSPDCRGSSKAKATTSSHKRFCYIFDVAKVEEYKNNLRSEYSRDSLNHASDHMFEGADSDTVINSVYNYLEGSIKQTFKKKYSKSVTNTFPSNAWYDTECKIARKTANQYAKTHDLSLPTNSEQYKSLQRKYKGIVQRKKRLYQNQNREKLSQMHTTNQTSCWKFWNKLTNKRTVTSNQPDIDTFHKYFSNQIRPPACAHFDQEHMHEISSSIPSLLNGQSYYKETNVHYICDNPITENEVLCHMKKLKCNKAAGIDGISGEFYKYVTDELVTPFCSVFNYVFDKGDYPSQWSEGLINALYKKGNHSDPDNYRKITITVAMAKIFDSILNARLYFKNEAMTLDDPFQFGFTPNRSTTDCVFVLDTIINYQKFKKKPVFLCFVDFTKAFDYINRNALYFKLKQQQIGDKMLKIISSMFDKAQSMVYHEGQISESMDSLFGVLQGGILSPKLFNEFLSDLSNYLNPENGIQINDTYFTHILYADDIVLMSDTATGLQNCINTLSEYKQTKIMQIAKNTPTNFMYNDQCIETVDTFKYLGHLITSKETFTVKCLNIWLPKHKKHSSHCKAKPNLVLVISTHYSP